MRKAREEDLSFCLGLARENMKAYYVVHGLTWDDERYQQEFSPDITFIVEIKGERIGYFRILDKAEGWYLSDVQLLSTHTGQGIGRALLTHIDEWVLARQGTTVTLRVFSDNPAVRLYKRTGYKVIGEERNRLVMRKQLVRAL